MIPFVVRWLIIWTFALCVSPHEHVDHVFWIRLYEFRRLKVCCRNDVLLWHFFIFTTFQEQVKRRNCLEAIDKYYLEMKYILVICDLSVANSAEQIIQSESMNSITSICFVIYCGHLLGCFDFERFLKNIIHRSVPISKALTGINLLLLTAINTD